MSNYGGDRRKRNQTLLIVEGNHEKNVLFRALLKSFPEMNIDMCNVWIYGTNIYQLYMDISNEYGENWAAEETDIDLPFVISKKQKHSTRRYKNDFTNIILVFDYERHDTYFSEIKILDMQKNFSDMTDMGQLYINYPMIESYLHLNGLPDSHYLERKIPVSLRPGNQYKQLVRKETGIGYIFEFPHRLDEFMEKRYPTIDKSNRDKCREEILNCSDTDGVVTVLHNNLQKAMSSDNLENLTHQLLCWIGNTGYIDNDVSYWKYVRRILREVILHNIRKANYIQNNQSLTELNDEEYKDCFRQVDMLGILEEQNNCSKDENNGFIWVLNTSVFIVAEYNFALLQNHKSEIKER